MDILIVGSYGVVTDALINKLNKEGHNIFVLTDEGYLGRKHKYVYEQYSFDYTCDSVADVIGSIKPSCMIYTGAYDPAFGWAHPNTDALRYVSAVMNVALAAARLNVPRFIYLSSNDVFEDSVVHTVREDDPATAASPKGLAIAQGEKTCLGCSSENGMQVTVLRLDHLYGVPHSAADVYSDCAVMCLNALKNGFVQGSDNMVRSHLHVSDAAQAVLLVVNARYIGYPVYHITDGEAVSMFALAKIVSGCDDNLRMEDDTGAAQSRLVLSGSRFNEAFTFRVFHHVPDAVPEIYLYMKKHIRRFLGADETGGGFFQTLRRLGRAMLPFIENLLCGVLLYTIVTRLGGSQYLQRIDLYLIYTIVFGIFYGKVQGIFAAAFSVAAYMLAAISAGTGAMIDPGSYVWIAVLFAVGMAVGHMKDKLSVSSQDKDDEIAYLTGRLADVNAINRSNMKIKDVLKDQIVSYDCSFATLYSVASKLDKANPIDVLFYAAQMLQELLRANDIAIYRVVRGGFARLVTSTTQRGKQLGVSCDFERFPDIYDALQKNRVFVNSKMQDELPMMVSAMYDENGMDMIIAVWNLHYEQMTMHEADMLTVLGHMIHDSVSRTNRYIDAVENRRYNGCSRILCYDAFREMVQVYRNAAKRGLAESAVLRVEDKAIPLKVMDERLSKMIRESDFLGVDAEGQVDILLSNATPAEAQIVIERMKAGGITCTVYNGI